MNGGGGEGEKRGQHVCCCRAVLSDKNAAVTIFAPYDDSFAYVAHEVGAASGALAIVDSISTAALMDLLPPGVIPAIMKAHVVPKVIKVRAPGWVGGWAPRGCEARLRAALCAWRWK